MDNEETHRRDTRALSTSSGKLPGTQTSAKAIAVVLKPLIDLHGEPRNWATAAPLYLDVLKDIPPELLAIAVRDQIASNPYFPKPAELRASIAEELMHYRRKRDEALRPRLSPPPPAPPPTAEEIAHVSALLRPLYASVAEKAGQLAGKRAFTPTPEQMAESRRALGIDTEIA